MISKTKKLALQLNILKSQCLTLNTPCMPQVFKPFKALLEAVPNIQTMPKTLFKVEGNLLQLLTKVEGLPVKKKKGNFRENVVSLRGHYSEAKPTKTATQFLTQGVLGSNSLKCVK